MASARGEAALIGAANRLKGVGRWQPAAGACRGANGFGAPRRGYWKRSYGAVGL